MKLNNTILSLAVASALGLVASGSASAALILTKAPTTPSGPAVLLAQEQKSSSTAIYSSSANEMDVQLSAAPTEYTTSPTSTLYFKVDLSGNAKFDTTQPTLSCMAYPVTGTIANATAVLVSSSFEGGLNQSTVSFQFPAEYTVLGESTTAPPCKIMIPRLNLTSNTTPVTISVDVSYRLGLTTKVIAYNGIVANFVKAATATVEPETGVTISVATESKKFLDTLTYATLGRLRYGLVDHTPLVVKKSGALGALINIAMADLIKDTNTVTVTGDSLRAASAVALVSNDVCPGAAPTTVVAGTYLGTLDSTAGTATFSGVAATDLETGVGLSVCLYVNGTTVIDRGQVTVALELANQENFEPDATLNPDNKLANILKNGTTLRVLNIPKPGGVEKAYVRFYNASNIPVRVMGSLYHETQGTLAESKELFSALGANAVGVLTSEEIATKMGVSWTDKRAWLQIDAESDSFRVMGTLVDSTGKTSNLSGSAHN